WNIVLIGPEDKGFENSRLHELQNVFFLGGKPSTQLPGYVKGFDIAINPQLINEITEVNYPLKIDEYLAMGVPVVATGTEFMTLFFSKDTYLAISKEQYILQIETALSEDSPEKRAERKKVAGSHSWENFVNKIYGQIELFEEKC
ncbi:MAG: glycosyltransferase, partial [Bacteroidetes bacterium]